VVALAIYRRRNDDSSGDFEQPAIGTGGFNYIILAPLPEFIVQPDDWVLVIGSRRFGRQAWERGITRASAKAPPVGEEPEERGNGGPVPVRMDLNGVKHRCQAVPPPRQRPHRPRPERESA